MSFAAEPLLNIARQISRSSKVYERSANANWTCWTCHFRHNHATRHIGKLGNSASFATARQHDVPGGSNPSRVVDGEPVTPATTSTALPSHSAKQRSAFTTRLSEITDSILARASIAGQHINTYTGTDYSGIEALRKEIIEQEVEVRSKHSDVSNAKTEHTAARAKQTASQKEIVGLLERKSSWTPGDLERYMQLVRSEHDDEQSVQKASAQLSLAERELEGTRSLLEKLERKQYHEEQIWSDTIRRNSTWVTIGLMGANILLLLAQISVFEPYRRRKIVNEIREALDERAVTPPADSAAVEHQVDLTVDPRGVTLEQIEYANALLDVAVADASVTTTAESAPGQSFDADQVSAVWPHDVRLFFAESLSDKAITLKKVDLTTFILESATAGFAVAGLIALLVARSVS